MGNTIWGVGVGVGVGVVDDDDDLPLHPLLLPEEVLIEILLWVPVISLLRFKSVSKSWRDLIQSPFFIHLHTTNTFFNSSSSNKFGSFILQRSPFQLGFNNDWIRERKMFMLSFGSGGSSDGDDDDHQVVFNKLDNLGFPPYYNKDFPTTTTTPHKNIIMVGSCNGLICLHDSKRRVVSLWNPATRQFRILPNSITIIEEGIEFVYDFIAFGFDVETKDYKVLRVSCFVPTTYIEQRQPECLCRVQVYSLSTDTWRLLEGINSLPAKPNRVLIGGELGVYLNGSYFFVGGKCSPKLLSIKELNEQGEIPNDNLMVSFDFTKEIFTTMQLPDHDRRYNLLLTQLGDKIALFTTRVRSSFGPIVVRPSPDDCDDENYDIWVLNEHGGGGDVNKKYSWAKLHSFQIKGRGATCIEPRGILNNGKFALIETRTNSTEYRGDVLNELHLLNLVTKEQEKSFRIRDRVRYAAVYNHSLVSIIGGGNGDDRSN